MNRKKFRRYQRTIRELKAEIVAKDQAIRWMRPLVNRDIEIEGVIMDILPIKMKTTCSRQELESSTFDFRSLRKFRLTEGVLNMVKNNALRLTQRELWGDMVEFEASVYVLIPRRERTDMPGMCGSCKEEDSCIEAQCGYTAGCRGWRSK